MSARLPLRLAGAPAVRRLVFTATRTRSCRLRCCRLHCRSEVAAAQDALVANEHRAAAELSAALQEAAAAAAAELESVQVGWVLGGARVNVVRVRVGGWNEGWGSVLYVCACECGVGRRMLGSL